eukprot:GHVU01235063.1.p1 GENE.GHVU01235063.1~~GHVU01235063.1.p1  ORF type:complete len:842 (+),score=249.34 GHVU01235063.1:92-2617(+)
MNIPRLRHLLFAGLAVFALLSNIPCFADETPDVGQAPVNVTESNIPDLTDAERETLMASKEGHEFQAEVNRLMDIIINSLYSQKEVFLRELISNSADALEKIRFLGVSDASALGASKDLHVKIDFDKEKKTITLLDNGVGMTKTDLINNLGTVAKSGTSNFLEALAQGGDVNLIGQFGVGFYSAFLVADKVTVVSKHNDDEQYVWESTADRSFYVARDRRDNLERGTQVTLHLKGDSENVLSQHFMEENIKKFSQFVQFPIYLKVEKTVEEEVELEDDEEKKDEEKKDEEKKDEEKKDEEKKDEEKEKPEEKKKKTKKVQKKVWEYVQQNPNKAIWLRPKEEVTEEEYHSFYKTIAKAFDTPLNHVHFNAEGEVDFKAILYVPSSAPYDMWSNYNSPSSTVKLYVRRVLVSDAIEDILPKYLNFVRGVVDSDDLPLKVDRESLAQNKIMKVISKKLTRKVLELIRKMAKEDEDKLVEAQEDAKKENKTEVIKPSTRYDKFIDQFGKSLRMGCYDDDLNRGKILRALRFHSTNSTGHMVSLDSYVERMKPGQEEIYYIAGETQEMMKKSPVLKAFTDKGFEVLLLTEPLDESCFARARDFDGRTLKSIQKSSTKLDETEMEKKKMKKLKDKYKPLLDWWKSAASSKISGVELSRTIGAQPVAVLANEGGYSAYMEKIMKAQTFSDPSMMKMYQRMRTLMINPDHVLIQRMLQLAEENKEGQQLKELGKDLLSMGMLASGFDVGEEAVDFGQSLFKYVLKDVAKDDVDSPIKEVEVEEDEAEAEAAGDSLIDADAPEAAVEGSTPVTDADTEMETETPKESEEPATEQKEGEEKEKEKEKDEL